MNKIIQILTGLLLLCSITLSGQESSLCYDSGITGSDSTIIISYAEKQCGFKENEYFFRKVEKILALIDRPMNFSVCRVRNLKNAVAFMDKDANRYINYDQDFIQKWDGLEKFESTTILAHEIGHHLCAHTLSLFENNFRSSWSKYCDPKSIDYNSSQCHAERIKYLFLRRMEELEADKFAGFIMARFGATLQQTQKVFYKMTENYKDTLFTHPSRDKRLRAVKAGFELGMESAASGRKVSMQEIKGRSLKLEIHNTDVISRNLLMRKIQQAATTAPIDSITKANPSQSGYSSQFIPAPGVFQPYLESRLQTSQIDEPDFYFEPGKFTATNGDDPRITMSINIAYEIKNNILRIIVFDGAQYQVIYSSTFDEKMIDMDDITNKFIDIYKDQFGKVVEILTPTPSIDSTKISRNNTAIVLVSQSGYRLSEPSLGSYIAGFQKTYDEWGKPVTLVGNILRGAYGIDSFFVRFYYNPMNQKMLQYSCRIKNYQRIKQSENYFLAGETNDAKKMTVMFDPVTSYVTRFVEASLTYEYENAKLNVIIANKGQTQPNDDSLEYRGPTFQYDSLGNLMSIGTESILGRGGSVVIRYQHDLGRKVLGPTVIPIMPDNFSYSLSEMMDWIPSQHHNLVTSYEIISGYDALSNLYSPLKFTLSNYHLDKNNRVISFDINDVLSNKKDPQIRTITNRYSQIKYLRLLK